MPLTFAMALVMILTTSGLPPFAAFFSKGLVIESIMEAGNLLQVILIFATTAITFAYSLRFFKLTFLGKGSEHLEKVHVHEAPKIMPSNCSCTCDYVCYLGIPRTCNRYLPRC